MLPHPGTSTKVRYGVIGVTFLAAFLLYLHRYCLPYMQQFVKEDMGLSNTQFGVCLSAFYWAYAAGQVPAGWFSDRWGARLTLPLYILTWSLFTCMMGLVTGLFMLVLVRIAVGLGQAGAYPTSAGIVRRWVPFRRRGTMSSLVAFGGRLGVGLTPILTAAVVVALVPLSTTSKLTRSDVLSPTLLVDRLLTAPSPTAESQSPIELRRAALAGELARRLPVGWLAVSEKKALEPTAQQLDELIQGLNQLLVQRELTRQLDLSELPMEREAQRLLATEALSGAQTERLNRLLLEAVFPASIKKVYAAGWRATMMLFGSLGLIFALLFVLVHRNTPSEHPRCNDEEVRLIEAEHPPSRAAVRGVPLRSMVRSRSLWLICLSQWCGNIAWTFLVTWLPRYLLEVHGIPFVQRGWLASLPLWMGWFGMLTGGFATDFVTRRLGLRWRTLPIVIGRWGAMVGYIVCVVHPSILTLSLALAGVGFLNDFCNPSSWAYKQDVGGSYVASIHGWANMWGNIGAAISPVLIQFIVGDGNWHWAFITCGAAYGISGLAALGVDARIAIVQEDEDEAQTA